MGPIILLVLVSLLLSTNGSDAETPLFVQTGRDLLLDVKENVTLKASEDFLWKFNEKDNFVKLSDNRKPIIYETGVDFFSHNYSLLLKNVNESNSGVYTALLSSRSDRTLVKHMVTVQDPVSPVKLTVKHCITDSSNLTVTCSTTDSRISSTFTCLNQTCSNEEGGPAELNTSASSLRVYLENGSVICNHSNKVSWKQDIIRIEDHCNKKKKDTLLSEEGTDVLKIILPIIISIFILISIILGAICYYRKKRTGKREVINTEYENPTEHIGNRYLLENINQPPNQATTNDDLPDNSKSEYCLVGHYTGPVESQNARGDSDLGSLYATVGKVAKP